jgi:K+-transporting ATPase ATPase A chain
VTFGYLLKQKKHGTVLFGTMAAIFLCTFIPALCFEAMKNPAVHDTFMMEGKEVRFGIGSSMLWDMATTVTSNGSVNSMLSSSAPMAAGLAMFNIMLGEVVFGGVGSGMYGMLLFIILTVFIAGLMVGRSPEYMGKKIEAYEIKLAVVGVLIPSIVILLFAAVAVMTEAGRSGVSSKGPHALSEILYAFSSSAGNNGSAFAGLNANTAFYNIMTALAMFLGRFGVIIPALAIAGSFVRKKITPTSAGTFPTDTFLFGVILMSTIVVVGGLTFFPALSLGPILEQMLMIKGVTF